MDFQYHQVVDGIAASFRGIPVIETGDDYVNIYFEEDIDEINITSDEVDDILKI